MKLSLKEYIQDYDMRGMIQIDGDFATINHDMESPQLSERDCRRAARQLVKTGQIHVCRHNVWCDVSRLRMFHVVSSEAGLYCPDLNAMHVFNYVPDDQKYVEGVYKLTQVNEIVLNTYYHELRHAFNQLCILLAGAASTYKTWALDELTARVAGQLALLAPMPELSGKVADVHVDYKIGSVFDPEIARNAIESATFMALNELIEYTSYIDEWTLFAKDPTIQLMPTMSSSNKMAWKQMRTFSIHGHPIDIYDCINKNLRQGIEHLINAYQRRAGRSMIRSGR